jgi:hypothetical protein
MGHPNFLFVDAGHGCGDVTVSGESAGRSDFFDTLQVVLRQPDIDGCGIFFQIFHTLRAGDGDYVIALVEQSRQRELRCRAAFFGSNFFQVLADAQVLFDVSLLEARMVFAVIVLLEILRFQRAQEPAAEWAVCNKRDAEFSGGGEDSVFGITCPERVLGLQSGDGMHPVGSTDCCCGGFRESEVFYLALLNKFCHGADGFFDGNFGVDAVLVVEVDDVDAKAAEAGFAGLLNVGGLAVDAHPSAGIIAYIAELRGEKNFIATIANGAADQLLIVSASVDVGGIEEVDAKVERSMDGLNGLFVIGGAVELRHAHAAESDCREGNFGFVELAILHFRIAHGISWGLKIE